MPPSCFFALFWLFYAFLVSINWMITGFTLSYIYSSDDISVLYFLVDEAITSKPIVME